MHKYIEMFYVLREYCIRLRFKEMSQMDPVHED